MVPLRYSNLHMIKLVRVVKIDIRDNVFIEQSVVVLPNVIIGPNAIVAAGVVVSRDVPEGSIVAGVAARVIGEVAKLVQKLEFKTNNLPWAHIIQQRDESFDSSLEPQLKQMRKAYFFDDK